jgi:TetR/AcrR family transcriptional repressor of nem operon
VITEANSGGTRAAILKEARRLIQTRSYLGFSFQDLADVIGIRKPSLYHHFPSKEALVVAVLKQNVEMFRAWAQGTPTAGDAKLLAYFRMYKYGLNPGRALCPAGALAAGWDDIDASVKSAARELRGVQIEWLGQVLGDLKPRPKADLKHLATYVFATCQGAMHSARMTERPEDFDLALAPLQQALLPARAVEDI